MFLSSAMVDAASRKLTLCLETVDSNGLLPLRGADRAYIRAFDFRRHLQKILPAHLEVFPSASPFAGAHLPAPPSLSTNITGRWVPGPDALLEAKAGTLDDISIDHTVKPAELRGGHTAARKRMTEFLRISFRYTATNTTNRSFTPPANSRPISTSDTSPRTKFLPQSPPWRTGGPKSLLFAAMAREKAGGI